MIRFLKNAKANSEHEIDLTSFDINAICYDIDIERYQFLTYYQLVPLLYSQIKSICTNKQHSDNLVSVDGREYIFRNNQKKLDNTRLIMAEIEAMYLDLLQVTRITV
jgi:hypothetical protein